MQLSAPRLTYAMTTGDMNTLRDLGDRRFSVVGQPAHVLSASQRSAEHTRQHHTFIEAQQRASGVRARPCSTGCYSLYNAHGQFIGRTVTGDGGGFCKSTLRAMATRMAHSEELAAACRMVDQDYEAFGAVTPMTVALMRKLLSTIDGA
ncbi:MAG: hypothetical protein K2X55_01085 [Burkholderiaceae bacterium]|nr:hypothetical protein [Burkholderiaceae bacterium]